MNESDIRQLLGLGSNVVGLLFSIIALLNIKSDEELGVLWVIAAALWFILAELRYSAARDLKRRGL